MKNNRILLFAPYGSWVVHHQVDAVLGAALKARGCEVLVLGCDGVFSNCLIAGKPHSKQICKSCTQSGINLFSVFQLPMIHLGRFISQKDRDECAEWVNQLELNKFKDACFEGGEIGKWIQYGMYAYYVSARFDYSNPEVEAIHRSLLYNGAILQRAYLKCLESFYPNHVVCYNSTTHIYYRTVFELSRQRGIPVLVHERGPIKDSFRMQINEHSRMSAGRLALWEKWKSIPLTVDECIKCKRFINDSELNKIKNPFFSQDTDIETVRETLRIPENAVIIVLFTSGDWEREAAEDPVLFDSQLDGIRKIVRTFNGKQAYLVIRHHPNMVRKTHIDRFFVQDLFRLNRNLSENIRVVMPTEKLSSYGIMWNADAAITFGSSTGLESIMRGCASISNVDNLFSNITNVNNLGSLNINSNDFDMSYWSIIENTMRRTADFKLDDLRYAYRSIHFFKFVEGYRFKSFGIRDVHYLDIRFKHIDELSPGNDPMLDVVCNYIMHNEPLYRVPGEKEKSRSADAETEFCQNELVDIKTRREQLKKCLAGNNKETRSLITVIRVRQDCTKGSEDSELALTVKRSRHKLVEQIEMGAPSFSDGTMFVHELNSALYRAKGEFVYVATDNIHVDESLFSTAIDFLEKPENEDYDGLVSGAWVCDNEGNIIDEVFTERKNTNDYQTVIQNMNSSEKPSALFPLFVWKKVSLVNLLSDLDNRASLDDITTEIFRQTISEHASLNLWKTLIPMITIFNPPKVKQLVSDGITLFNEGKWEEAQAVLDKAKSLGESVPGLDYYRALTNVRMGRLWEAFSVVEAGIEADPGDEQLRNLLEQIIKEVGDRDLQYEDIAASVESVEGWLVPGQEKVLFDKVKSLPDFSTILEIGAYHGRSTVAMAFACLGTGKRIFSIDTFMGMTKGGTKKQGNTFLDIWHGNIRRLGLEKYVKSLPGFSHEILEKWKSESKLDFVFIDGSHHYVDIIKDFELVYPLVKDGGWIALHDVEPGWPGPWRVWRETAMPLLSSHEYCSNLACGRKERGKPFVLPSEDDSFSYSKEWAEYLVQFAPKLSKAMMISMEDGKGSGADDPELERAEQIIALISDHAFLKNPLREMLKLEASCDPYLHLWNALVFEREGEIEKAVEALREAGKVSQNETNSRIEMHLNRLAGKIRPSDESVGQHETEGFDIEKDGCIFLNTCYQGFLNDFQKKNSETLSQSYLEHKNAIQRQFFGDSDFYSEGLKKVGWKADDLIINCPDLQQAWAKENRFEGNDLEICIEQIRRARPQVVYLQNMGMGTKEFLSVIRSYTELIVGQIASPIPQQADISGFDIIFSSFPHFVEKFRKMGVTSYYQPLAFDPRVLEKVRESQKIHPVTFVGGISPSHGKGYQLLEKLAELLPIDIWGYGAASLPGNSPIKKRHHGEAWGLDMFSLLSQSGITINRHIDVAENYANNMRLFEATGCGALLITDYKDNLNELFEIGKEIVAYRSTEECVALVKYYLNNPKEAEEIARAGQARALRSHTYTKRMEQTGEIFERHLRYKREKGSIPLPDMSKISYGHTLIQPSEITESMTSAWKSDKIPLRQRALTQKELKSMYKGETPPPYKVLADCLRPYMHPGCSILEIGCASGYYYEVLEYLLNMRISYTGVDYSEPLVAMAREYYPKATFSVADGALLPFENEQFLVAVSSCVLLHVPNYREHIKETVRIAERFVVVHRTPICRQRPTWYFKKMAYGVETVELTFNEDEIVSEFIANGLKLIRSHEYYSNPGQDRYEITYIFEKKSLSGLSHEQRIIEKEHVERDKKFRSGVQEVEDISRSLGPDNGDPGNDMLLNSVSIIDKVINGGENIQAVFNDPIIKDLLKNPGKAGLSTDDLEGKTDQQKTEMIVGEYFAKIAANAGKLASRLLFHAQWGYATPDWFDHRHHILDPEKHFNDYWCESADNVLRVLPLHGKLLNLCAGDGFYDYYFFRNRAKEIVCIDINPETHRQALRLHRSENIMYLIENILTCELDKAIYDVVVIRGAIEHFSQDDQQSIFSRASAVLKVGGWFCGDTPANLDKSKGRMLPAHENEWSDEGEMRRELEKVFGHVETYSMISADRTTLFWRCRKDESHP